MSASLTIKENMLFSSSIHSTSLLSAQLKSSPSATKLNNSKNLVVKLLLAQLIPNSLIWNIQWNQENKEDSDQWTFHWFQILTNIFQKLMDAFVKMEMIKEYHIELLISLTETVLSDIHQSTISQLEEIPMNTWD